MSANPEPLPGTWSGVDSPVPRLRRLRPGLLRKSVFLAFLGMAPWVAAEPPPREDAEVEVETLPPLTVRSSRSVRRPAEVPAAVTKVPRPQIQTARPGRTLDEGLLTVPGVFFQNPFNFAQDLRISIRGFGARSPFGVRGIRVLVDGIPMTLPDGQTQLDAIDPGIVESIEILRGPSSSLYGNASGGVISIHTEDAPEVPFQAKPRGMAGAFGFRKFQLQVGGRLERVRYRLFGTHWRREGYRQHSAVENTLGQGKFRLPLGPRSEGTLWVSHFHSPVAEDPGALTRAEVEANPEQASSRNLQFDAGESVTEQTVGLRYRKNFDAQTEISLTPYVIHRTFANRLPFTPGGQVEFERIAPGLVMTVVSDAQPFDRPNRLILGVDVAYQRDDRKRFDNLQGTRGPLALDQVESVLSVGPFLRDEWQPFDGLQLAGGLRYDRVHFDLNDAFPADGDQSGSKTLSEWSGTLGAVIHVSDLLHFYANFATVFEVPTTTELIVNPSGGPGFNPDLDSQTSVSYEVGLKGGAEEEWSFDLAFFLIQSQDELIPFELPGSPGRTFFRNAGESERKGVEVGARVRPAPFLEAALAYAYSDFEFTDFVSGGTNFAGNDIPGVPKHRLTGRLKGELPSGGFARFEWQTVSDFFVDNANSVENDSYTATQLVVGKKGRADALEWEVFLGIDNLLDETFNANTRINAQNGRFFEPAPPFNVFGGLALTWTPEAGAPN